MHNNGEPLLPNIGKDLTADGADERRWATMFVKMIQRFDDFLPEADPPPAETRRTAPFQRTFPNASASSA